MKLSNKINCWAFPVLHVNRHLIHKAVTRNLNNGYRIQYKKKMGADGASCQGEKAET